MLFATVAFRDLTGARGAPDPELCQDVRQRASTREWRTHVRPLSRRGFIAGTAAGLATAGAALTLPVQLAGASPAERDHLTTAPATEAAATTEAGTATEAVTGAAAATALPLIAHVRDLSSGEIALYSGEREILIRDPRLAHRLLAEAIGGR